MKKVAFFGATKLCMVLLLQLNMFALNAQEGKIWTRIKNFNDTKILIEKDRLISSDSSLNKMIQDLRITAITIALPAARTEELRTIYEISCNCDENTLLQEVARHSKIFSSPEIAPFYEPLNTPNDYYTTFANDYALNLINAQNAWELTSGDSSVIIAISDLNYDLNHEELIGKYSYVTPNNMNPVTTHGTAVAVTAAGKTNNNLGKSSIGYNCGLQLRAMNYNEVLAATYSGARVINLSWTSGCYENMYTQQIVDEVYNNGVVLVASAGNGSTCNDPTNLVYPSAHNHVISVTSVGPLNNHERIIGNPATTHQHNATVDIAAPGYDVALTIGPGIYTTGNGTSFAAPFVSGTIGLMLSVNPCLTVDQVEFILKETALNIDTINPQYIGGLGAGRLDAAAAVLMASSFSTLNVVGMKSIDCESKSQSVEIAVQNGIEPFSVSWSNNDTSMIVNNLEQGEHYSVLVTDSIGCFGTFEIDADTIVPLLINPQITNVSCSGQNNGSIELTMEENWDSNQFIWNTNDTTKDIYQLHEGIYELTIIDSSGCDTNFIFTITQPEQLHVFGETIFNNSNQFSIDIHVYGGNSPYTFTWNNGSIDEDLTNIQSGFYEVEIIDSLGCNISFNTLIELNSMSSIANDKSEILIYPNPSIDNFYLEYNNYTPSSICIFKINGELIQKYSVNSNDKKSLISGLRNGIYIVEISTESGQKLYKTLTHL